MALDLVVAYLCHKNNTNSVYFSLIEWENDIFLLRNSEKNVHLEVRVFDCDSDQTLESILNVKTKKNSGTKTIVIQQTKEPK